MYLVYYLWRFLLPVTPNGSHQTQPLSDFVPFSILYLKKSFWTRCDLSEHKMRSNGRWIHLKFIECLCPRHVFAVWNKKRKEERRIIYMRMVYNFFMWRLSKMFIKANLQNCWLQTILCCVSVFCELFASVFCYHETGLHR